MSERPKKRKCTEVKPFAMKIVAGPEHIQVKPPPSDAVPPFNEPRKECVLSTSQQQRAMEMLGRALYEHRQKEKPKAPVILTSLPKGYIMEYTTNYKVRGHPSKVYFHSLSTFLEHLLWLEAMSHPESIEPRRECECVLCTKPSYKQASAEASAPSDSTSPEPTTEPSPSRESTPTTPTENSETIRIYPLKKVLIERHVNPHYYYPETFTIPLPKIQQADESVLLKSLRSSSPS